MTELTLALWQDRSPAGQVEDAFATMAQATRAAAGLGADAIVFPELFVTGYDRDDLSSLALTRDEMLERLAPLTRETRCAVCVGYPEPTEHGLANAAICVSASGALLANHRKLQLFGATEAQRFVAGDTYTVFELAGRRAALLICYDVEFSHHVGVLKARGVEVILVPTAAMHPFVHIGDHVVPAMAVNHALAIVYANYCGHEANTHYFGRSSIVAADGQTLARAGEAPCLLLARVPMRHDPAVLSTQDRDFRMIS